MRVAYEEEEEEDVEKRRGLSFGTEATAYVEPTTKRWRELRDGASAGIHWRPKSFAARSDPSSCVKEFSPRADPIYGSLCGDTSEISGALKTYRRKAPILPVRSS